MNRFLKIALLVLLVIIIPAGGYYWWYQQAEQIINRRVEALLDLGRYQKIALETREQMSEDIADVFSNKTEVVAENPFPSGFQSRANILAVLEEFQLFLTSCQIEELDRRLAITGNSANVILPIRAVLVFGKSGTQTEERTLFMTFQKEAGWKLTRLEVR